MTLRFVACLLLALTTGFAQAQSWPTRPIKMVVPFPAGGLDYSTSGIRSAAVIQSESQRWSMVIREANVKPE